MLPAIRKNISAIEIPQRHYNSAVEANSYAINSYALGISGKLCGVDGELNLSEKRAFLGLFPYFGLEHIPILRETANDDSSVYLMCRRFCKFTNENSTISAKLFGRLFKLAGSDNTVNVYEISFLEKTCGMLGLSKTFLEKALEYYFLASVKKFEGNFAKREDIKTFYRNQIIKLHPDIYAGDSLLSYRVKSKIISLANERLKLLNAHYKTSLT
ncbi:MAG TPA: hypothetical protein DIV86_01455 [Alphaproteobacteria bacterium]|nr:hypothetical protein [Alphaproteobacteria bacterium]